MDIRVGFGFDIHKFSEKTNRKLILGGVEIDYERGLEGVSDADVVLHSLADSLLSSISAPDIGTLFPPTSPSSKNLNSEIILKKAKEYIDKEGFSISNIVITIVCDEPKIYPYKEKIQKKISELLNIPPERINIYGKTTEGVLWQQNKGIAVFTTTLLVKP